MMVNAVLTNLGIVLVTSIIGFIIDRIMHSQMGYSFTVLQSFVSFILFIPSSIFLRKYLDVSDDFEKYMKIASLVIMAILFLDVLFPLYPEF